MFKESQPIECEAVQVSDQMRCERCNLLWDINDPEPPKCLNGHSLFEIQRNKLKRINHNE